MNKKLLLTTILLGSSLFLFGCQSPTETGQYDKLAECLTEKGVTMYGTETCPHCQNQKKAFGSSFAKVNYVDCGTNPDACVKENIEGVPTRILSDGTRLPGEQDLAELAQKAGCEL